MGVNMPAKTVVFMGLKKFNGVVHRYLNSSEYV
jgi:superfamily II RNA helicase